MTERRRAFSLVEVAIAVAIAGAGVAVVLGLLPGLVRRTAGSLDEQTALRLAGAVRSELVTRAASSFEGLAAEIPVMTTDPETGWRLVAGQGGTGLRPLATGEPPASDKYFLVVVRRFDGGMPGYAPGAAFVAFDVVVSWPYRAAGPAGPAAVTPRAERQMVNFSVSLRR